MRLTGGRGNALIVHTAALFSEELGQSPKLVSSLFADVELSASHDIPTVLIWDDAEEMARLARLSHPRVTVKTAGLTPEQTALANRLAQSIHRLSPETVAALHAVLDTTIQQPKPQRRCGDAR